VHLYRIKFKNNKCRDTPKRVSKKKYDALKGFIKGMSSDLGG